METSNKCDDHLVRMIRFPSQQIVNEICLDARLRIAPGVPRTRSHRRRNPEEILLCKRKHERGSVSLV